MLICCLENLKNLVLTDTVVHQHQVSRLHNVLCLGHQAVVPVPPGVEVLNLDAVLGEPVPVVEVDGVQGGVDLIPGPGVGLGAGRARGDQPSLGTASDHVVGKVRPLGSLDTGKIFRIFNFLSFQSPKIIIFKIIVGVIM